MGIALFKEEDEYSEYIQGKICEPLMKDKKYCLRILINSNSYSKYIVNHLASYFSYAPILIDNQNEGSFSPQVVFTYFPTESKEFVTLCNYFTANGGERSITIGRFTKKENLSVMERDKFPMSQFSLERSAYYLIDKLELFEILDTLDCQCKIDIRKIELIQNTPDTARLNILTNLNNLKQGKSVVLRNVNFDFNSLSF